MKILALDPGTFETGFVVLEGDRILASGVQPNPKILYLLREHREYTDSSFSRPWCPIYADVLAIEMVASYGMPVGAEVFETVRWIGRFQQAWPEPESVRFVFRKAVKEHLCGTHLAKDPHIRQRLIDMIGPVGTVKNRGPLYGVKSHAWAALAVAVTAQQTGGWHRETVAEAA